MIRAIPPDEYAAWPRSGHVCGAIHQLRQAVEQSTVRGESCNALARILRELETSELPLAQSLDRIAGRRVVEDEQTEISVLRSAR